MLRYTQVLNQTKYEALNDLFYRPPRNTYMLAFLHNSQIDLQKLFDKSFLDLFMKKAFHNFPTRG